MYWSATRKFGAVSNGFILLNYNMYWSATRKFGAVSNWFILLGYNMYWSATRKFGAVSNRFILLGYNMCCFSTPTQPCGLLYGNVQLKNEQKKWTKKQASKESVVAWLENKPCVVSVGASVKLVSGRERDLHLLKIFQYQLLFYTSVQLWWRRQPISALPTDNCSGKYSQ